MAPVAVMYAAMAVMAVSGIMQSQAQRKAGKEAEMLANLNATNAKNASEFQAKQLEQNAGQAVAASQRAAIEKRRQSAFMSSRALAVAAASGGGTLDPNVVGVLAGFDAEGDYASRGELFKGADAGRSMFLDAASARFSGESQSSALKYQGLTAREASKRAATNTLMKTGASMLSMYGGAGTSSSSGLSSGTSLAPAGTGSSTWVNPDYAFA